jgi:protein-disulfide isomerase
VKRIKALGRTTLVVTGIAALATLASAAEEPPLSPTQEEAVERIVRDYLLEHPEVILEAIQRMHDAERVTELERQQASLAEFRPALYDSPGSPIAGNPEGDVTVIEFFDYRCSYCKRVVEHLLSAVAEDGQVRLVFKELPILGADSVFAARAALAARLQGEALYSDLHVALMGSKTGVTEPVVMAIAEAIGLDIERLRVDMEAPEVEEEIRQNYILARALGIDGTPAFIIGDEVVPGAVGLDDLKDMIAKARNGEG